MRIAFQDAAGAYIDKFWVEPAETDGDWTVCCGKMTAPPRTTQIAVELCFTGRGTDEAWFAEPRIALSEPERETTVRVAIVHRPHVYDDYADALAGYLPLIIEATNMGADFVLITELLSCHASTQETAEPLGGPMSTTLMQAAHDNAIHVVTSIPELHDGLAYNTAVLIDPQGDLIGRYRKVHLPPQEIDAGTTEGDDFPVFDTEFCKVGLMICYDYFFPEQTLMLSKRGAQIVFLPIWGGHLQPGMWDAVTRTRAIDNGIHLVASGIDVPSRIVRSDGSIVAERNEPGVTVAELPLLDGQAPQPRVWPFSGTWPWRNCYMTERRNDVYKDIARGAR